MDGRKRKLVLAVVVALAIAAVVCFVVFVPKQDAQTAPSKASEEQAEEEPIQTGLVEIDGETYYFKDDGSKTEEAWVELDGDKLWFDDDGRMATGWRDIDGNRYYFDEDGHVARGWNELDGAWYHFDDDGVMTRSAWVQGDDGYRWLDEDGSLATGWRNINGSWYLLAEDGLRTRGWASSDGSWYYFNEDGTCASSAWVETDGSWYYLKSDGKAGASEWVETDGVYYYLKADGSCAESEWVEIAGDWYYFKADNSPAASERVYDGFGWYYVDASGKLAHDTWVSLDDGVFRLGSDGRFTTGWAEYGGSYYYLGSDGHPVANGWIDYDGYWYYLGENGALASYGVSVVERRVQTPEGTVVGWYYAPKTEQNVPLIIFSHGFMGSGTNFSDDAFVLAAKGIAVYCFDFIGGSPSSASGGNTANMSAITEASQLNAIVSAARGWSGVDTSRIFLAGHSQGGLVSTLVASYRNDVAGIILLSPGLNLGEIVRSYIPSLELAPSTLTVYGMTLGRRYAEDVWDLTLSDVVSGYHGYSLVIHGTADTVISADVSRYAKSQWGSKCTLHLIDGCDHYGTVTYNPDVVAWILEFVRSF